MWMVKDRKCLQLNRKYSNQAARMIVCNFVGNSVPRLICHSERTHYENTPIQIYRKFYLKN